MAITTVTALLFAALVAVADVSLWLGRHALDSARFAAATELVLASRESREVLAEQAVAAVVAEFPVLGVFEAAAIEVLASAFDSPALDGIRRAAAEEIHDRIVRGDDDPVFVSLIPVREVVLEPIALIVPSAAESIPNELLDDIEVIEAGALPSLRTAATAGPWLGFFALFLAVGLAVGLIVLSPNRPLAVTAVGLGMALGGVLGAVAAPMGRSIARGWATSEFAEVLTLGVYDRLVGALLARSAVLIVAGILVAAGGGIWSLLAAKGSAEAS
jgi:hypothetical protein